MNPRLLLLLFAMSIPAGAQSAASLYQHACGPTSAAFTVEHVDRQPPSAPESGKALVYVIQKSKGIRFTTRVGLDGAWVNVVDGDSYVPLSVTPGEHHLCAATQDRKKPEVELVRFNAEPGKVYFYLLRGMTGSNDSGRFITMELGPVDSDEARYLIASDPQSVANPRP